MKDIFYSYVYATNLIVYFWITYYPNIPNFVIVSTNATSEKHG